MNPATLCTVAQNPHYPDKIYIVMLYKNAREIWGIGGIYKQKGKLYLGDMYKYMEKLVLDIILWRIYMLQLDIYIYS